MAFYGLKISGDTLAAILFCATAYYLTAFALRSLSIFAEQQALRRATKIKEGPEQVRAEVSEIQGFGPGQDEYMDPFDEMVDDAVTEANTQLSKLERWMSIRRQLIGMNIVAFDFVLPLSFGVLACTLAGESADFSAISNLI